MTINAKLLVDKINSKINAGNLTEVELLELSAAIKTIEEHAVNSVATIADLPLASENTGRFVFVEAIGDYRYSNGEDWVRDYDSTLTSTAFSWGSNSQGRLGDGTTIDRSSPVTVVGGFTDWCQIDGGFFITAVLRPNGTIWTWGDNSVGQLGDGCTVNRSSPVSVVGGFTDWCQVSAGGGHTAALRTNGTIWSWGLNYTNGSLGDGTTVGRSSPVSVVGGFTDWCQVSAGISHTVAVRTNGTLWSWGGNSQGQLGDGSAGPGNCKSSPVSVVGGFTDWCQVSAGGGHTAALRTNGTPWTWGKNYYGELGNNIGGFGCFTPSPVSVVGGFTDWCQVIAGSNNSAAIRTNGTLWTWGGSCCGSLGDGTMQPRSSPVSVLGGFTNWCQFTITKYFTLAIQTDSSLWAWGRNTNGTLGDGTTVHKSSPVLIGYNWCQVSISGTDTSVGIKVKGFGFNTP